MTFTIKNLKYVKAHDPRLAYNGVYTLSWHRGGRVCLYKKDILNSEGHAPLVRGVFNSDDVVEVKNCTTWIRKKDKDSYLAVF